MQTPARAARLVAIGVMLAGAAAAAPAADYAVRLARPAAAGEKRLAVGSLENDDHLAGRKAGVPSDERQTATIGLSLLWW